MAIEKELLDQLLAGRDPNEIFARDGLLDDLKGLADSLNIVGACRRPLGTVSNFVHEAGCRHQITNRSPKITANWVFASDHSRGGRFQSWAAWLSTKYSSLVAASSPGKCPRVRTARRSFEFSASIALVV